MLGLQVHATMPGTGYQNSHVCVYNKHLLNGRLLYRGSGMLESCVSFSSVEVKMEISLLAHCGQVLGGSYPALILALITG